MHFHFYNKHFSLINVIIVRTAIEFSSSIINFDFDFPNKLSNLSISSLFSSIKIISCQLDYPHYLRVLITCKKAFRLIFVL